MWSEDNNTPGNINNLTPPIITPDFFKRTMFPFKAIVTPNALPFPWNLKMFDSRFCYVLWERFEMT
jgi:hypothetical protein